MVFVLRWVPRKLLCSWTGSASVKRWLNSSSRPVRGGKSTLHPHGHQCTWRGSRPHPHRTLNGTAAGTITDWNSAVTVFPMDPIRECPGVTSFSVHQLEFLP